MSTGNDTELNFILSVEDELTAGAEDAQSALTALVDGPYEGELSIAATVDDQATMPLDSIGEAAAGAQDSIDGAAGSMNGLAEASTESAGAATESSDSMGGVADAATVLSGAQSGAAMSGRMVTTMMRTLGKEAGVSKGALNEATTAMRMGTMGSRAMSGGLGEAGMALVKMGAYGLAAAAVLGSVAYAWQTNHDHIRDIIMTLRLEAEDAFDSIGDAVGAAGDRLESFGHRFPVVGAAGAAYVSFLKGGLIGTVNNLTDSLYAEGQAHNKATAASEELAAAQENENNVAGDLREATENLTQAKRDMVDADYKIQETEFAEIGAKNNLTDALQRQAEAHDKLTKLQNGETYTTEELMGAQEKLASSQEAVASVNRRLADAVQNLSDAEKQAADDIVSAQQGVTDAVKNAADERVRADEQVKNAVGQLRDAEGRLTDTINSEREAQKRLTEAREEAQRNLEDLDARVAGNAISSERAQWRLIDAQRKLEETRANSSATSEDIAKAELDVREAALDLQNSHRQSIRDEQELQEARAKGIAGSDAVVGAQKDIANAARATQAAQEALKAAQLGVTQAAQEGAERIIAAGAAIMSAQARLAQAQVDGSRRVAEATQGVTDAQRNVDKAEKDAAKSQADLTLLLGGGRNAAKNLADATRDARDADYQVEISKLHVSKATTDSARAFEDANIQIEKVNREEQNYRDTTGAMVDAIQRRIAAFDVAGSGGFFDKIREWMRDALDPTVQHSPSLVDRVESGVNQMIDHYSRLGNHFHQNRLTMQPSIPVAPATAGTTGGVVYQFPNLREFKIVADHTTTYEEIMRKFEQHISRMGY